MTNAPLERSKPHDANDLAQLLQRCDDARAHVAIAGGNTLHGMGVPPARTDVELITTALDRIVEDAPADLTIAAQSGVTLARLANALARHGTFVPFDAPRAHDATIGGTLAAGWLGPRRHCYGRPRDYILGTTAVLADGTIARAGGMVVKNVAGYDMSRLYVGSFGTLAVLVQANLKTQPLPPHARVFLARLPEGTRTRALAQCASLIVPPAAALWIEGFHPAIDGEDGVEGRLFILLEGSALLLERATRDLRSALGRAGVPETTIVDAGAHEAFARVLDAYITCIGERSITYRILATQHDAENRARSVRALIERFELRTDLVVDVMNGDIIVRASDLDAHAFGMKSAMLDDALHDLEPHAVILACEHTKRSQLQAWGAPPQALDRMRALKARFDPHGILNPGRFVGGI